MTDLIAFRAVIELLKENNKVNTIKEVYKKCLLENKKEVSKIKNIVKEIYEPYTDEQISRKISLILKEKDWINTFYKINIKCLHPLNVRFVLKLTKKK